MTTTPEPTGQTKQSCTVNAAGDLKPSPKKGEAPWQQRNLDVVFSKQTRRTWAMDCYSEELQAAIKAEQEIREPRVSESLRARFVG